MVNGAFEGTHQEEGGSLGKGNMSPSGSKVIGVVALLDAAHVCCSAGRFELIEETPVRCGWQ
tara:strand:- start:13 stop:198 length:186 start_codon:yes stop_codon:yes gene_type:complete